MIGQKSIKSFFSPAGKKRELDELKGREHVAHVIMMMMVMTTVALLRAEPRFLHPPCVRVLFTRWWNCTKHTSISSQGKKLKVERGDDELLSPEQLERIARNKAAALERLSSRRGPAGVGESWSSALGAEFNKNYFTSLLNFVDDERQKHTVYPPLEQMFTWTQMCKIEDVKVVVLGQDPYHGPNQAHGLCFSVQRPVPPPPSLVNMYKELESDIEGFRHPGHGDLTGWAKQGVLLLNAVLTVRAHQANSHKDKGWETFTDAVVQWLSTNLDGLVFMLWGAYAQKKGAAIDRKRHHVLQAVHPSPLSAHRGFFGCKHFSKTNELLLKSGKKPIDWKAL